MPGLEWPNRIGEVSFDLSGEAASLWCESHSQGLYPQTPTEKPGLPRKGWVSSKCKEMEVCMRGDSLRLKHYSREHKANAGCLVKQQAGDSQGRSLRKAPDHVEEGWRDG